MVSVEILKDLSCLKDLNEEQLAQIAQIAVEKSFKKGSYVHKQDDPAEALYIVTSGRVAIEIDLPRHRKICIDIVEAGELFGWSAVVPPHVFTAAALCMEETTLVELTRGPLYDLIDHNTSLKASIMETLSKIIATRLRDTRLQLSYLLGWD